MSTLARGEADAFGVDRWEFAETARAAVAALGDHTAVVGYWHQLAFVRRLLRETVGAEAFDLVVWRANLDHWSDRAARDGLESIELGRRALGVTS